MSDELEAVRAVQVGVRGFAAEMKAKGIHVGMGRVPRCVTCGEKWPCPSSADDPSVGAVGDQGEQQNG